MDVALLLHWFLGLEETATSNGLIVYRMLHHFYGSDIWIF